MTKIDYKTAGVNIEAGDQAITRVKDHIESTFSPNVLTNIGGFAACYDLKSIMQDYDNPVLVQSVDGVGTKTMLAKMTGDYSHLGHDLLSAATNDIVVIGAKPLTFLDYIASDEISPDKIGQIILSIVEACKENGVSLVGGETAEMPSVYHEGEHDLVGIITGVVEKDKMITGKTIKVGDTVFGLTSSGLHTNGYSLARKLFFDENFYAYDEKMPELNGKTLAEVLQAPHINYTRCVRDLLDHNVDIHGMAHITGGGFLENIPRVLPAGTAIDIRKNTWPMQPIFMLMEKLGHLEDKDLYQTFNMGIGMIIVADPAAKQTIEAVMRNHPYTTVHEIGKVVAGPKKEVRLLS